MKKNILYVLCYRAPNYIRTKSLLAGLEMLEHIHLHRIVNRSRGLLRYPEVFAKLVFFRLTQSADTIVVGFRGHEILPFVKAIFPRTRIVFDELMSPSLALKWERPTQTLPALIGKCTFFVEKFFLHMSNDVLTDTDFHKKWLCQAYDLPDSNVHAVPASADEATPFSRRTSDSTFSVLFYGSILPLHGITPMLEAAKELRDENISFVYIGGNRKQADCIEQYLTEHKLLNVKYLRWVDFEILINEYISCCSLNLGGPFGGTPQAKVVVTGKAQQSLAMGIPTVVGKIDEDFGFRHGKNCILVEQGCGRKLAEGIMWGYQNQDNLDEIGRLGKSLYMERFSNQVVAQKMKELLI